MNPTIHRPAGRLALALGLVAGAWLIPSASTSGAETALPAGTATAVAEPNLIQLAQADTAPVERPVSYAPDQADRGKKKYEKECQECHGAIESMSQVTRERNLEMGWCLDCHLSQEASVDCLSCHY